MAVGQTKTARFDYRYRPLSWECSETFEKAWVIVPKELVPSREFWISHLYGHVSIYQTNAIKSETISVEGFAVSKRRKVSKGGECGTMILCMTLCIIQLTEMSAPAWLDLTLCKINRMYAKVQDNMVVDSVDWSIVYFPKKNETKRPASFNLIHNLYLGKVYVYRYNFVTSNQETKLKTINELQLLHFQNAQPVMNETIMEDVKNATLDTTNRK